MKRALAIFILYASIVNFAGAQGLEKKYDKIPLDSVLLEFYSNYNIKFAYDQTLAESVIVSGVYHGSSYIKIVEEILDNYSFDYELINGTYVIYPSFKSETKYEEEITIHGTIKDRSTGETLPFANVFSLDYSISTVSNQDGYFSIFDRIS